MRRTNKDRKPKDDEEQGELLGEAEDQISNSRAKSKGAKDEDNEASENEVAPRRRGFAGRAARSSASEESAENENSRTALRKNDSGATADNKATEIPSDVPDEKNKVVDDTQAAAPKSGMRSLLNRFGVGGKSKDAAATPTDDDAAASADTAKKGRSFFKSSDKDGKGKKGPGEDEHDVEKGPTDMEKSLYLGPMRVLEPLRTDVVKALEARQKRLERLSAINVPEIHYVGQISSGRKIAQDPSEGIICR